MDSSDESYDGSSMNSSDDDDSSVDDDSCINSSSSIESDESFCINLLLRNYLMSVPFKTKTTPTTLSNFFSSTCWLGS